MQRINGPGHVNNRFVEEDIDISRPPTQLTAKWFNSVQEEIISVINAAGIALNGNSYTQLLMSINVLISNSHFASGTRLVFAQASAPTGWTQDESDVANNRMLRVVNTAGGGVGGDLDPTFNNVVPPHTHGFTTGYESVVHTHFVNDPGHAHKPFDGTSTFLTSPGDWNGVGGGSNARFNGGTQTQSAVTGISLGTESALHTHSGSTDNGSSSTVWTPRYNNVIICIKN